MVKDIYKRKTRRIRCTWCGKNWADLPSRLCPGCEAYQSHTELRPISKEDGMVVQKKRLQVRV